MQKSSKKSWTRLRSQTKSGKYEKFESQQPDKFTLSIGQRPGKKATIVPATKNEGKDPPVLPLGFGLSLQFPERFVSCLMLAFALYWHAAFTANDWLYLLSSGFLVACLASLLLPLMQLSELKVEGAMPPEVVVTEATEILVSLRRLNTFGFLSSLLPIKSVRLAVGMLRVSAAKQTRDKVMPPETICIDTNSSEITLRYSTPALRRGVYEMESVQLSSGFPFGLVWWRRSVTITKDKRGHKLRLIVYPKTVPISGYFLFKLEGLTARIGLLISTSSLLNKSTIVRGIREYRSGDSPRHIHWPSSAHQGKLLVREFDSEMLPAFSVFLDLSANWKNEDQFELAIMLTQALVHLGHKLGTMPELMLYPTLNSQTLAGLSADLPQIPPGIELLAEVLARVEPTVPSRNESETDYIRRMVSQSFNDRPLLTITPINESLVKYTPGRGDQFVFPVELALVRGINEQDLDSAGKPARKGRAPEKGSEKVGSSRWSLQTSHLATISDEYDLEGL